MPENVNCLEKYLSLGNIPNELKTRRQWVHWKLVERDGRATKLPYNPKTGELADSTKPETWGSIQEALIATEMHKTNGIGFVFSEDDPYCGIDLDSCRNAETGAIEPEAQQYIEQFRSYTEITPSGKGFHIILKGTLPPGGRRKGKIEHYDRARYFTFTGNVLNDSSAIADRQAELEAFHQEIFGAQEEKEATNKSFSMPPEPIGLDDETLIEKAKNADDGGKFSRLWAGNWSEYPSQSEADQALCNKLAFWCGCDREHMNRLFQKSGLYRGKWDRADYSGKTLDRAISLCSEVYKPPKAQPCNDECPPVEWAQGYSGKPSDIQPEQQTTTNHNIGNRRQQECNTDITIGNIRTTWSNRGVAALINTYLSEFSGTFLIRDLDEYVRSGLGIDKLPRPYQFYRSKMLSQMIQDGRLQRTARGGFRIIDRDLEDLNFLAAEGKPHPIRLPLGLNELVEVQEKEIILVTGNPDSGKTAVALCVSLSNMERSCCTTLNTSTYIYHFVSETGPSAFKQKLLAVSPEMPKEYSAKVRTLVYKPQSIQDQVHPDAINIIDYLEPRDGDFREIVPTITAIFNRLVSGVAVICLQQHPNAPPRGGLGVFEKPRLIVSLSNDKERRCKMATILKGKNSKSGRELIGLEMDYIVRRKGTLVECLMDKWEFRKANKRPFYNTDWI